MANIVRVGGVGSLKPIYYEAQGDLGTINTDFTITYTAPKNGYAFCMGIANGSNYVTVNNGPRMEMTHDAEYLLSGAPSVTVGTINSLIVKCKKGDVITCYVRSERAVSNALAFFSME